MNEQMIVWTSIIVLVGVALVARTAKGLTLFSGKGNHMPLIEIGKEEDMFYCPGDEYDREED